MTFNELQQLKTPCYIINEAKFKENIKKIYIPFKNQWKGNLLIGYSVKTNHNQELMKAAKDMGMFAETVSDEEYNWAEKVGFLQDNIIYNGVQKSEEKLLYALRNNSFVNLDNFDEIQLLKKYKKELVQKKIRIGLRVNFDLEKECPNETTAGQEVSRFGFCVENGDLEKAIYELNIMQIQLNGLHLHYSSKTRSLNIFSALAKKACDIIKNYHLQEKINFIDIGGGFFGGQKLFGKPSMEEYAKTICNIFQKNLCTKKITLILEPGASIIATAVDYTSRVINVKNIQDTNIVTIDGNCLHINPFLAKREPVYQFIVRGGENGNKDRFISKQIICGSTCMENDRILRLKNQVKLLKGDFLYCTYVGAYTMVYNNCFINLPPYVYIKRQGKYFLCRKQKLKWLEENL